MALRLASAEVNAVWALVQIQLAAPKLQLTRLRLSDN
jgi:hypothetical protein